MKFSSFADKASYQNDRITVKNVKRMRDLLVQIFCRTIAESIWYCPGATIEKIAGGLEVIFVRLRDNKKQKVDHPRKTFADGTQVWKVVTIPSDREAFFIRNGKNLVKLLREEVK